VSTTVPGTPAILSGIRKRRLDADKFLPEPDAAQNEVRIEPNVSLAELFEFDYSSSRLTGENPHVFRARGPSRGLGGVFSRKAPAADAKLQQTCTEPFGVERHNPFPNAPLAPGFRWCRGGNHTAANPEGWYRCRI
jgi:hypothetical protein